jgi:hypothetical protein
MPTILRVDKKNTDPQEVVRILQAVKDGNADLSPENVVRFGQIKQRAVRWTPSVGQPEGAVKL